MTWPPVSTPRPIRDVFSNSTPRIVAAAALRMSMIPGAIGVCTCRSRVIHDEGRHAEPGTAVPDHAFQSAFVAPRPLRRVAAAGVENGLNPPLLNPRVADT